MFEEVLSRNVRRAMSKNCQLRVGLMSSGGGVYIYRIIEKGSRVFIMSSGTGHDRIVGLEVEIRWSDICFGCTILGPATGFCRITLIPTKDHGKNFE